MRETQVQSLGREDPLEKEMATHSSTLAWKIPWTEEPGRLPSTGSQRVGHDGATSVSFPFPSPLCNQKASQVAPVVKNPAANAGDLRDPGSIPEWGRSPGGGHGNRSSIVAWRISWTEKHCVIKVLWPCRITALAETHVSSFLHQDLLFTVIFEQISGVGNYYFVGSQADFYTNCWGAVREAFQVDGDTKCKDT